MSESHVPEMSTWGSGAAAECLDQVAELCRSLAKLQWVRKPDGTAFHLAAEKENGRKGILSTVGTFEGGPVITLRVELFRGPNHIRLRPEAFFDHLSKLGERNRIVSPKGGSPGESSLWVELGIKASPLSLTRSNLLLADLKNLDGLAAALQEELPAGESDKDLTSAYQDISELLDPVLPWGEGDVSGISLLSDWAADVVDFLAGSSSVALASPFPCALDRALASVALKGRRAGLTFGKVKLPAVNSRVLSELTGKAPGLVVVPAVRMTLGTSPYELGNEMKALLSSLAGAGRPVVFTGRYEELQSILHGGQGGLNDPLQPVVFHLPEIPMDDLTRFAVLTAGRTCGGLPESVVKDLAEETLAFLGHLNPPEQRRLLPLMAARSVRSWSSGRESAGLSPPATFVSMAHGVTETLSGLSTRPRVSRSSEVQERFVEVLTDSSLLPHLKDSILAQEAALEQLVSRLRTEALTRPAHQPLRYCAQGTPATGKSESASLLAHRLGIPLINIDAASMPDYHTAAAQLLGSGRGIVGSHQSGRLEQAAKHHAGTLIEVSDIDHAPPPVRSALADLFLQVLETGEAQSATGAMFSCSNLIFAFTMNLPDGLDERVHKGLGFNSTPSAGEVKRRVATEISTMLSSAFVSRIGTPILFSPLDGEALGSIMESAVRRALASAAVRLGSSAPEIAIDPGTGRKLVAAMESRLISFGARALLEKGRGLAADALVDLLDRGEMPKDGIIRVSAGDEGTLTLSIQ